MKYRVSAQENHPSLGHSVTATSNFLRSIELKLRSKTTAYPMGYTCMHKGFMSSTWISMDKQCRLNTLVMQRSQPGILEFFSCNAIIVVQLYAYNVVC